MSILIKGIDLPEACGPAVLTIYECIDGHGIPREYKLSATQIQAIPPHGPLIDADELKRFMYHHAFELDSADQRWDSGCWVRYRLFENAMKVAPTIIKAEEGEEA